MIVLLCVACAPPLKDSFGLALRRGETPVQPPVPDSLQVDLEVLPQAPGLAPFSARLYAEPLHRYRLDVFGFPSMLAASWLWERGGWTLVRHDRREVSHGTGAGLDLEGLPLRVPDLNAVLGFLWGAPLPGFQEAGVFSGTGNGGETLRWLHGGEEWTARFEPITGVCREAASPNLMLRYARHRARGNLVVAERTEIFVDGKLELILQVRSWTRAPSWKRDPFSLKIPESYEQR